MSKLTALEQSVNAGIGTEVVMHLSARDAEQVKSGLSSGSFMLNMALSGNPRVGYVWGRIIELYGPEQSGKTTLALHAVAEAQKLDVPCMYIDAEHALDPGYMERIGINLEDLSLIQPDYGEQSLEGVIQSIKAGYKLIIVDSVAALTPKAELDGNMGDQHVGRQARMMGQGLRKMVGIASKAKATVIFVNQIREKVGVMFGNPEVTPGGRALKFAASYRIEVRSPRGGKIEEKTLEKEKYEIGTKSNIHIVKNKLYPPFRKTHFNIVYGHGIDRSADAVEFLASKGVWASGGSKVDFAGEKYTKKTLIIALHKNNNPELKKAVLKKLKEVQG